MRNMNYKQISITIWTALALWAALWGYQHGVCIGMIGGILIGFNLGAWFPRIEMRRQIAAETREVLEEEKARSQDAIDRTGFFG